MKAELESGTAIATMFQTVDDDILLTSNQTCARVGGVSHMCLWRWQRDERVNFPQPIQINRRNYWRLGDLRRWQAERASQKVAA